MKIPLELDGQRVDQALTQLLGSLSRSQVQKKIKADLVAVNGKMVAASARVRAGDVVEVAEEKKVESNTVMARPTYTVIEQHPEWLVIEKPSGVVVHPASGFRGLSLSEVLLQDFPELAGVGEDARRPGIVHRLDRDVSGVLIVARTSESFLNLKKQFQHGSVQKVYLGLVHGALARSSGEIDFPIARSTTDRRKMAAQPGKEGRPALTRFEVVRGYQQFTYLKLLPKTGRTHQLRVHLNAINHPLVGDTVYHPRKWKVRTDLGRIFLHAHQLTVTDLLGEQHTYHSPLPRECEAFLNGLVSAGKAG